MLTLNNAHLTVTVLDPVADQARFGARYCTGGYIYQIADQRAGDLLSGPTYPHDFNWFDGQGIPDAFTNRLGDPADPNNPIQLAIGIGMIDTAGNTVREFCAWEVTETPEALRFETAQSYHTWSLRLTRELTLRHRTLKSESRLRNTGSGVIPLRWFPHPFFPLYDTGECCKFDIGVRVPDNPGYELLPNGFIGQKNLPWDRRGHFLALEHDAADKLTVLQKHPKLGLVSAMCHYRLAWMPIWGNKNTFSFEPYFEQRVAPGEEAHWWIDYDF